MNSHDNDFNLMYLNNDHNDILFFAQIFHFHILAYSIIFRNQLFFVINFHRIVITENTLQIKIFQL